MSNKIDLEQVSRLLDQLKLSYQFNDDKAGLCTGVTLSSGPLPIVIGITADYWLSLSTWGLFKNPIGDDTIFLDLYKNLLKENNFTKSGKFYINQSNYIEFAVDLRLMDLNEYLLEEAINLIAFVVDQKLPQLAEPYLPYLFK